MIWVAILGIISSIILFRVLRGIVFITVLSSQLIAESLRDSKAKKQSRTMKKRPVIKVESISKFTVLAGARR